MLDWETEFLKWFEILDVETIERINYNKKKWKKQWILKNKIYLVPK